MTNSIFGGPLALGPCNVYFDTITGGANLYLGGTDQVLVKFGVEKADLVYSQNGTAAADRVVTATMCTVELGLAQATLERMNQTIQGFRLQTNTAGTIIGFSFGDAIGELDSSIVKQMTLKLIEDGADSSDTFKQLTFWKVAPSASVEAVFNAGDQRFLQCVFTCYKDTSHLDSEDKASYFGAGTIT